MLKNEILVLVIEYHEFGYGRWVDREKIDGFILGCVHCTHDASLIDRTVVPLPFADNLILIYNKNLEDSQRELNEEAKTTLNYIAKPQVMIPELNLKIYSRCIICRRGTDGKLESLRGEDFDLCELHLKK